MRTMTSEVRGTVLVLLLFAELGVAAYSALFAGLMSAWFLSDTQAIQLTTFGWWRIGLGRFTIFAAAALLGAGVVYLINRAALRVLRLSYAKLPLRSAVALGGLVTLATLAGSVYFIATQPYM